MPRGGSKPGERRGGRQKGTKDARQKARTQTLEQELASGQEMPLEHLLRVMRDEEESKERRYAAAKDAAPYCHARKLDANVTGSFEVVVKSQTVTHAAD